MNNFDILSVDANMMNTLAPRCWSCNDEAWKRCTNCSEWTCQSDSVHQRDGNFYCNLCDSKKFGVKHYCGMEPYLPAEDFPSGYFVLNSSQMPGTPPRSVFLEEDKSLDMEEELPKSSKSGLEKHKENIKNATYHWAMEDMHQTSSYNSFFDMLIGETDDRWIIPSYLVVKLSDDSTRNDSIFELASFLSQAIEYDGLYDTYVAETQSLLLDFCPDNPGIVRLFAAYNGLMALPKNERNEEALRKIVGDEHADDELFYMFV